MTKIKPKRNMARSVRSMQELQLEKAKLKLELVKTEESIKSNYRNIISAFSLHNIVSTLRTEFTSSSSIFLKAFSFGKNWYNRRKKKKKHEHKFENSFEKDKKME